MISNQPLQSTGREYAGNHPPFWIDDMQPYQRTQSYRSFNPKFIIAFGYMFIYTEYINMNDLHESPQ